MEIITYSLRGKQKDSDAYYKCVSDFTDKVLVKAKRLLGLEVTQYQRNFIKLKEAAIEEGLLELLTLGIYWRVYILSAIKLNKFTGKILKKVSKFRENNQKLRWGLDPLKGYLTTRYLTGRKKSFYKFPKYNSENLRLLLNWLEASGEFNQEVGRLKNWLEYIKQLPVERGSMILASAVTLAKWFETNSLEVLGHFTENVESYLKESISRHHWKEDLVFCGQSRIEYHLNMVGAEIMNRIYQNDFQKSSQKILLLPTCMRDPSEGICHAKLEGKGLKCVGCSVSCSVKRITELGRNYNLIVRMVPHESSISSTKTDKSLFDKGCGVIGVSCVLNLIAGGWMLLEKGLPAQCVLLDYCGCKKHWHEEGIATCINEKQLVRIISGVMAEENQSR